MVTIALRTAIGACGGSGAASSGRSTADADTHRVVVVLKGPNLGRSLTAKGLEEIPDGIRVAVFWRKVNDRVRQRLKPRSKNSSGRGPSSTSTPSQRGRFTEATRLRPTLLSRNCNMR